MTDRKQYKNNSIKNELYKKDYNYCIRDSPALQKQQRNSQKQKPWWADMRYKYVARLTSSELLSWPSRVTVSLVTTCLRPSGPIVVSVTTRFVYDVGPDPDSERVSVVTVLVPDLNGNFILLKACLLQQQKHVTSCPIFSGLIYPVLPGWEMSLQIF